MFNVETSGTYRSHMMWLVAIRNLSTLLEWADFQCIDPMNQPGSFNVQDPSFICLILTDYVAHPGVLQNQIVLVAQMTNGQKNHPLTREVSSPWQ
jgi:hypothetical protein